MGEWSIYRLTVIGSRDAVREFSLDVRARPVTTLQHNWETGQERQGMSSERMNTLTAGLWNKQYHFQVSRRGGLPHFKKLSGRYDELMFIVVYHDIGPGHYAGCIMFRGRQSRELVASEELIDSIMAKNGVDYESDTDDNYFNMLLADDDLIDWVNDQLLAKALSRAKRLLRARNSSTT